MPAILSALRCRSVCSRIRQWRSLTVEDITERADVGRATFCSHFRDREDLFARVTADLLEELAERLQPVVSDSTPTAGDGSLQFLEVRHRAHARVEDRIRCGRTTGFGRLPSRHFGINAVWLELSLTAIDLLAWTRTLLLGGELADAEPKKLRYRLPATGYRTPPPASPEQPAASTCGSPQPGPGATN